MSSTTKLLTGIRASVDHADMSSIDSSFAISALFGVLIVFLDGVMRFSASRTTLIIFIVRDCTRKDPSHGEQSIEITNALTGFQYYSNAPYLVFFSFSFSGHDISELDKLGTSEMQKNVEGNPI